MKKILGLDLGTTSIGWALIEEAENRENSKIIKLGVRVNPLSVDEKINFEGGKPISTNADRTLKRGARRNLDRFQLRRDNLIGILKDHSFIKNDTALTEIGKNTTHQTLFLRAKAAREKIALEDLSKVLLAINKKRGYKSSRKTKEESDGVAVDGMAVAKILYEDELTPGEYTFSLLKNKKKHIPDFYPSDLKSEFTAIWKNQKLYYPELLTEDLFLELQDKNKGQTWTICSKPFGIEGKYLKGSKDEQRLLKYQFRKDGLKEQLDLEQLAIALQEINNDINGTSGYLGKISDRSKILYTDKITVGEYMFDQIKKDPHTPLKNQVFYRQDYLDEFELIWNTQAAFYQQLSEELKSEIRDVVIFYQRPLKSQKGLLSHCIFESWEQEYYDQIKEKTRKRTVGHRVIPKSSPLFQQFKIWQNINDLEFKYIGKNIDELKKEDLIIDKKLVTLKIDQEDRELLFNEANSKANSKGKISTTEVLKLLGLSSKDWKCNFEEGINANTTNQKLLDVYQTIATREGYGHDWSKKTSREIWEELQVVFNDIGIDNAILGFDPLIEGNEYSSQKNLELWHLLYSAGDGGKVQEDDRLIYGNQDVALRKKLHLKYGFKPEYAKMLSNISFPNDYGSLSSRAIRKIMPHLMEGHDYYEACDLAGYNHSSSLNKEENDNRILADKLELISKNSLRNPVVEKILNQVVNLVNQVIDTYGKPDEIRIELARELKKSTEERKRMTQYINTATKLNQDIAKTIQKDFGFTPTKNDVVKYKLWEELSSRGYKSLFSDTYISKEDLFSKKIDIEHIIPKALVYDDSFSNKTLAYREVNLKKANRTAMDFISQDKSKDIEVYKERVEALYNKGKGAITKAKRDKLLKAAGDINEGFIERDLRNSQYIAKKSRTLLEKVCKTVTPTTGMITDKLREEWGIINVLKELNLDKYRALGLVEMEQRKHGKEVEKIQDWTKRNDHRHHAMDALAVAFTTVSHIQYINNLNARKNKLHEKHKLILGIENKITKLVVNKNGKNKRIYIKPFPNFRSQAKTNLEEILISFKAKNKVVTKNINKTKKEGGYNRKISLTPRGQLHKETIYGKSLTPEVKTTKLNKKFAFAKAEQIIDQKQKILVLEYLKKYKDNPEIAFDGKTFNEDPLLWHNKPLTDVLCYKEIYTIRKDVAPDLKIDKVVDNGTKEILRKRLKEYGDNAKEAFSNLEKNPIWQNEERGIAIKKVTITGVTNAEPLHTAKDHLGNDLIGENSIKIPADYVSLGNNHHVAIYKDRKDKLQEKVVSLYEAVIRSNQGLPIIDKTYQQEEGLEFLFTMKQNEMFVFPSEEFDPKEIDLMDDKNRKLISANLFRVQKMGSKDYWFRHHYETEVTNNIDFAYKRIQTANHLSDIKKVRLNHIGKIVHIGEY
ncbi:type II CRISPR RNA-guided endonuclease Cas9 [Nonlabens sp.]|uniref:type II CRISPR RNA-guided endonuclease Cas9 n=1 Tax=Nonlabens sp. TaxID=1888209 RepID=UPI001BCAE67D|nr:type II CRISPR RNA-guided endonuclease Cas9 [Nonlabens sp.]